MKTIRLSFWLFAIPFFIQAQETTINTEALQTFDKIIGLENTNLYNGKRYYSIYKTTEAQHNFFLTPNFIKGYVTYNGDSFFNIDLKYDVLNDKLIFKPLGEKAFINIELIEDKVTDFKLNSHYFINANTIKENQNLVSGYVEVIYNTPTLKLYAKRKKSVSERINNNKLVYLFSNEPRFFMAYNGDLNEIKSSKTFRKLFPEFNKALKAEIKENKNRFENDDEGLYLFIMQWLDFKLNNSSN